MPGDSLTRHEDPVDSLRTVTLIEEAIVQRGLRQLRGAVRDEAGRKVLDEILAKAVGSLHELEDIVHEWRRGTGEPLHAPTHPAPDPDELLRSFIDVKESEAMVLRRVARAAPSALRPRLEALADQAEAQARRLDALTR